MMWVECRGIGYKYKKFRNFRENWPQIMLKIGGLYMKNKILILALGITVFLGGYASANGINGFFKGFPIVKVMVNGDEVKSDIPAINFNGSTMLPLRKMAENLNFAVEWDDKTWTASVTKPQVDMILCDYYGEAESPEQALEIQDDYGRTLLIDRIIGNPFSRFETGTYSFNAYIDVSGLESGKSYVDRLLIVDSEGNTIYTSPQNEPYLMPQGQSGFLYTLGIQDITFASTGVYTMKYQLSVGGEYMTVYEKQLEVN